MKMFKGASLVAVLVLSQVMGCAGFKAKSLPEIEQEKLKASVTSKTRVYSEWKIQSPHLSSLSPENIAKAEVNLKQKFESALAAADCCVVVQSEAEADIVVKAVSHDENSRAAFVAAFITGFSLYTIPSWATAHVHLTATASKSDKSVKLAEYDLRDSMTMVQWLPMIFAFPFANPFSEGKEMEENVYKNLIFAMQKDGVLPSPQ
jgi:hypothetical protein